MGNYSDQSQRPKVERQGKTAYVRPMLDTSDDIHPLFAGAPKSTEFKKLRKRLVQNVREAVEVYGMVEAGAKWLMCLSGGKDSYTLLAVLTELQWRGLLPVEILA